MITLFLSLKSWCVIKRDFPLLFEDDFKNNGRPKEYYLDELLGFVVYGVYNSRFICRRLVDWINNNDEFVNYILNDKKPIKSIIICFTVKYIVNQCIFLLHNKIRD